MKKLAIVFVALFLIGCAAQQAPEYTNEVDNMKLTSPAFENNRDIATEYTCDGDDISPELNIADIPENTQTLALIVDDPDAPVGTWVHWVVFNIPKETTTIKKATNPGTQGINDFKKQDYGGPCPPSGTHRYFFKLYALDTTLDLQEGATKADLESAMQGHIITQAQLIGNYSR